MKIDWKSLAQSSGYKSIKQAFTKLIQAENRRRQKGWNSYTSKEEFTKKFNWIIGRAKHYAYHQNRTVEEVLNEWEEKRSYNISNYYSDHGFPKLNSKKGITSNVNLIARTIRYYKKSRWGKRDYPLRTKVDRITRQSRIKEQLSRLTADMAKRRRKELGKKDRWPWYKKKNL